MADPLAVIGAHPVLQMDALGLPMGSGHFGAAAPPAFQNIKPPRENIDTVLESNFNYGADVGNDIAPLNSLAGGISRSVADAARAKQLAEKISSPNGFWERPIVDDAGNVIEGQHRIEAARMLGFENVPVYRVQDLERGFPTDKMKQAIQSTQQTHSDQVHGIMGHVFDMIKQSGSPQAALTDFQFPLGFEDRFKAALNAAINPQSAIGR